RATPHVNERGTPPATDSPGSMAATPRPATAVGRDDRARYCLRLPRRSAGHANRTAHKACAIDHGVGGQCGRRVGERESQVESRTHWRGKDLRRRRNNQYMETALSREVAGMIHEDVNNMR